MHMRTEQLYVTEPGAIERAATLLEQGYLVVFPTDTVYGIGAAAFDESAIAALYRVKGRPSEKGIPILLADREDVHKVARDIPPRAQALLDRFWPGALTLIVPRRTDVPANLSPDETIAVRVPDNEIARAIIRQAGGAVATSSANLSGAAPARDGDEAMQALQGLVAAVVDGGPVEHGVASTIVDCTVTPPAVLRSGALSAAALSLDTV